MVPDIGGYTGRTLRVNLTDRGIDVEETDLKLARLLIGGRGYAGKVLFDEVGPEVGPLSSENKLIFATGPATGTPMPGSGRHLIVTKSPATGLFLDSYSGGFFAAEMKFAGYDFLIIEGRADTPSYLWVNDADVHIRDASHLWGSTGWEAETRLKEDVGDERARVSVIGPAGERLCNFAVVQNDYYHQCGRGGVGAVMGAKNLKAVVVRGTGGIRVADPRALLALLAEVERGVQDSLNSARPSDILRERMEMGTAYSLNLTNKAGILPNRNFKYGGFERAENIDGYAFRKKVIRDVACYSCNMGCTKITRPTDARYGDFVLGGPEHETNAVFGSNCEVDSMDAIIHANMLCDTLGLDVISVGNVIGWAMECFERGILTQNDTGGVELRFGDAEALFTMIHQIAYREGIGDLLAKGVRQAAKEVGQGSEEFAMEVKGLEYPVYRPGPLSPAFGLNFAVAERGACHRRAWPVVVEQVKLEPFVSEGRAALVKQLYDERLPWHCAVTCDSVVRQFGMGHREAALGLSAITGESWTVEDMQTVSERVASLLRAYNIREGATRADDTLAPRSFEPDERGRGEGRALTREMLDTMLDEYYELRGWDRDGIPPDDLLVALGLGDVASGLHVRRGV